MARIKATPHEASEACDIFECASPATVLVDNGRSRHDVCRTCFDTGIAEARKRATVHLVWEAAD